MELVFDVVQEVGAGSQPQALHSPDNVVQVIFTDADGHIFAKEAPTPEGEWTNREFTPEYMICGDQDVENMKLKFASDSIFVVWKNPTDEGEVIPEAPNTTHSTRQRLAVWVLRQDLSKYLIGGDIEFRLDDPVSRMSVEFENPKYSVSHEDNTILTPGTSLTFFFRSGDSAKYIMGRFFIDRNSMGVTESSTSADGRNGIGKFLADQTFDQDNVYQVQNLKLLGEAILESFGVVNYWVGDSDQNRGFEFPQDMNGLEGLKEIIKTNMSWQLREDLSGRIGFGDKASDGFAQASTYYFKRDEDIFSRNVVRDDQEAYSKVCVHNDDYSIAVYKDVDFRFVMGRKKTLHVSVAKDTNLTDATTYATELAGLLKSVGTIETFVGPWRPHLLVGDNATIVGNGTKLLGIITSIRHSFGRSGYSTEFVVDSGSTANKTRISDYINKISGRNESTQVKRLY